MTVTHDATKEMIAELRRMANRTGNKQAEKAMRDGATWLEDVENNRVELQNENEKLRQRLADKDEQLAGWKALLDASIASKNTASDNSAGDAFTSTKRRQLRPNYDYTGVLVTFMNSGERTKAICAEKREKGKQYPSAYYFRERAKDLGFPITANAAGDYVLLSRTDNVEDEP
ncbi:MAG: hypothetical protein Q4P20_10895 [Eubacteriales bacterium]|nr:hypothetical protein [Eubacteriales bacterium]